jgi:hypothetical protein
MPISFTHKSGQNIVPITRLTALWALSESMLGGLLHAAHVPFRGMIISSAAVIIICLIAHFSEKRGEILKATIIVLLIKAAISPHTPVAAYGAVFLQGILGEIFFFKKRFFAFSSMMVGTVVGILTGSQRIITLTLIFGTTFWDAINQFINYLIKEFFMSSIGEMSLNFSLVLIGTYILIHAAFGFAAGLLASKLPQKINSERAKEMILHEKELIIGSVGTADKKKKRKPWWKRPSYYLIFIFAGILLIITYTNPNAINLSQKSILLMIIRAILITAIWFFFLSPVFMIIIKKMFLKKQNKYTNEISGIINHFPQYRYIVAAIWKLSSKQKGVRRFSYFITALITNVLTLKFPDQ